MLIVFTGNGKGKTTAALGVALRALSWKKRVAIIQFIKGNKEVGEYKFLKSYKLQANKLINIFQFFDDTKLSITEKSILNNPEYKKSCEEAWEFAKKVIEEKKHDLIVLDEICNAMHLGLLKEKDVLDFIRRNSSLICCNSDISVILTGRNASEKLIDLADLVTEMKEVKHPFQKGISAKEGIDY
uniref:Cob(I)yrinic acid a,c-diamide adenosyltransferase n=1 Tax=candidate division CPR3 bacterium TaxID=2268181 RepID=A0A7C4M021_UNCC3